MRENPRRSSATSPRDARLKSRRRLEALNGQGAGVVVVGVAVEQDLHVVQAKLFHSP
jgi:hypothetical protein